MTYKINLPVVFSLVLFVVGFNLDAMYRSQARLLFYVIGIIFLLFAVVEKKEDEVEEH